MAPMVNHPYPTTGDYAVPMPRPADAVGASLHRVHGVEPVLPGDMLALLARVDRRGNA